MATDDEDDEDRDRGDRDDEDDRDRRNTGKGGGRGGEMVTVQERQRRWRGPTRRYGQAQRRPADRPNTQAAYSTGPGEAVEYHYHRVPTYHHQYAQDLATGMENNPT